MREQLQRLMDQTLDIIQQLSDTDYEELEALAEQRERIFADLIRDQEQYSEIEKQEYSRLVQEILQYDKMIIDRMQQLMSEAQEGLRHIHTLKKQQHAYQTRGPVDSLFFDKKN